MNSKLYRLREFINPVDHHSLIVDSSAGLSLGSLPGLEHFSEAVGPVLPLLDGIVTSPGQARRLFQRTRQDAALLVRGDWTNALRGSDFVLPPEIIHHIPLLAPQDALDLGASALVLFFLLGYEEEIEAGSLRRTVQSALDGNQFGLPLIVDVQPTGSRVVQYKKAVELGLSYALEGGADGVAVPWPGRDSYKTIITMAEDLSVWVKPSTLEDVEEVLTQVLELSGTGLWLGDSVFAQPDPVNVLTMLGRKLHQNTQAEGI